MHQYELFNITESDELDCVSQCDVEREYSCYHELMFSGLG